MIFVSLVVLPTSIFADQTNSNQNYSCLPFSTVFKGEGKFQRLVQNAQAENWQALPLGERTARVGEALLGTPYKNFTLEIDNHIEAPSVDFEGMDCWTFYEVSLGFARMLRMKNGGYTPADLLKMIELERYRHGVCTGQYLSRLHFLEDLFKDNEQRGLAENVTAKLPGATPMHARRVREMSVMWKHYRYLRNNPKLRAGMAQIEANDSAISVVHVPKSHVAAAEAGIHSGDVIAITSRDTGGYTCHVGLAFRDKENVVHFMHASSKRHKVIVDSRLSSYLKQSHGQIGIIVCRPLEAPGAQTASHLLVSQ